MPAASPFSLPKKKAGREARLSFIREDDVHETSNWTPLIRLGISGRLGFG